MRQASRSRNASMRTVRALGLKSRVRVSSRWVLTAAHCVTNFIDGELQTEWAPGLRIGFGISNLTDTGASATRVSKPLHHPYRPAPVRSCARARLAWEGRQRS